MQEENKNKKSFSQNMKAELKKVIWPTGKQVVKSTVTTISFVLLISVILIVLNTAFSFLSDKWFDIVLDREDNKIINNEQIINGSENKDGEENNSNSNVEEDNIADGSIENENSNDEATTNQENNVTNNDASVENSVTE